MGIDRFYVEDMTYRLTKYINQRLRDDERIIDWAFYMYGKDNLVVCIDYGWNLHSKMQIMVNSPYDFDAVKMMFECQFEKNLEELTQKMGGDALELWGKE